MTVNFAAIVLAGGQSSRMGRDKALIPIQGVPLIRQVCEVAGNCADPVYIVTSWPERYQDILPGNCQLIREVPMTGDNKPAGPLVGFARGLARVQTDWVLLLACDLPRLRVEVLQEWATQLENVPFDKIAFVPRSPKGWEPLCGFYRRGCLPLVIEFINQGGRSFQQWLAQHPVEELPLSDAQMLFNCNTPADLAALDN